jgi:type II secretory pathway pseudopilin PulG
MEHEQQSPNTQPQQTGDGSDQSAETQQQSGNAAHHADLTGDSDIQQDVAAAAHEGDGQRSGTGGSVARIALIVAGIVVVLIGGASAAAYTMHTWPFSSAPYSNDELLAGLVQQLQTVDSGEYSYSFSFKVTERSEDIDLAPSEQRAQQTSGILREVIGALSQRYDQLQTAALTQVATSSGYAPGIGGEPPVRSGDVAPNIGIDTTRGSSDSPNMHASGVGTSLFSEPGSALSLSISGAFMQHSSTSASGRANITGEVESEGTTLSADVDVIATPEAGYVRINEAPSPFFIDFSSMTDTWVRLETNQAKQLSQQQTGYQTPENAAQLQEQVQTIASVAREYDLYSASHKQTELASGDTGYRYTILLQPAELIAFYETVTKQLEEEYGDEALWQYSPAMKRKLQYLQSPQGKYVREYTDITIDVRTDGMPTQLRVDNTFAPPQTGRNEQVQFESEFAFELARVNEPITISRPNDYVSWQQLQKGMMGATGTSTSGTSTESRVNMDRGANGRPSSAEVQESLAKARSRARDARRISDLQQIKLALELYRDENGSYPPTLEGQYLVEPGYLSTLPTDPSTSASYRYNQIENGAQYHLGATIYTDMEALQEDADYTSQGRSGTINGGDDTACDGSSSGSCFDIVPQ